MQREILAEDNRLHDCWIGVFTWSRVAIIYTTGHYEYNLAIALCFRFRVLKHP